MPTDGDPYTTHDHLYQPEAITFPEPHIAPQVYVHSPTASSKSSRSSHSRSSSQASRQHSVRTNSQLSRPHTISTDFEAKFEQERNAYYASQPGGQPKRHHISTRRPEREQRRDLLAQLTEHMEWQREADARQQSRQEEILDRLVSDAQRVKQVTKAQSSASKARTNMRTVEAELMYAREEIDRTKARLAAEEDARVAAEEQADRMAEHYQKLALSVVRLEGLQRGRIRGVQDGYHLYLRQQALPYNHDVPSTAYIEEIPVGVVDDDAASRDTQIVRHVRPQRYYTDGAPRAKPRTATARAPGSTAPAVSREPSNQDPQPPSPPSTQHYVPPPVPQPPPRQSHSRAPSVERTMPSMYQPHRKLSAITEASNSNSTPHSANVPTPLAGSTASPLRHHTFDTPVASTSRHTLDNGLPNGGYAYRSHQRPPSPHQSHSTQSPQIEIKPPTPPEHSDPLPAQYPSLSPMQNTRSVPVTPRTTYTQPPTPRSTYAQPQTPRTEYVQPSTPRFNGYSHPQTPRTNYSQPQTPRAPYSQVAGTTNVQPPASFTVPPVPTPNYRQSSATNRPPHVPITIPHGAMRMPDSDDTGTMTPLSESAHLTSFPKVERADKEKDRLSAIPEGGSTVSGSSPLPGVADSIADWRGSTISTDVFTPSTISNANLLHPNMPTQGGLAPPNHLQRRPSTGSRSTHSIEFNIEPPSRPASGDVGDMQQASGFLSPNSAPQALPAEPPSTSQPVIPDTGDYADDSDEDSSDNGSSATGTPSSFVAYVQPPSEPEAAGSQTPKMLPSANWGQSNGGWQQQPQQVPNGYGVLPRDAIGPSRSTSASSGGIATDGRVWPPPSGTASSTHSGKGRSPSGSGSVGQKSPRYETTATPPGFTYPLPPGRMASSKGGKSPKPSRRASMASDSTSTTSSTDDSSDVSSQSGRTAVSAGGSSNWRHGTVANGVVGGNVVSTGPALQTGILNKKTSNGESPPDATTYMNTLANSATGTPRFGRGTPGAMGGSKKLPTGQSPYTGFKSLYA